jgi:OOP family OmpA-OmpF porin
MRGAAIALLALWAHGLSAADAPGVWYLGGGVALNNVFANEDTGLYGSSERGDSDGGFVINGGYRFNPYFAVEAGYLDGGEPRFTSLVVQSGDPVGIVGTDVRQETDAFEASLLGILPFLQIWEVYIKGGVAVWDASSLQRLTPLAGGLIERRVDRDGTDFLLGLGFGVTVAQRAHLRFEYQAFRTDDALLALTDGREARFDSFTVELHWRFGSFLP